MKIYTSITEKINQGKKMFATLIDPDKITVQRLKDTVIKAEKAGVDYIFIGGSLLIDNCVEDSIRIIKETTSIPVILFPGNPLQVSERADALLFLSLISGRNPEMLIGNHVTIAPILRKSKLEILPTGYMLIESGKLTSVSYISNTTPIPYDKDDIAMCTAIAGELLGLKLIYMDAGSGANNTIRSSMISRVKENISIPLIIGGGIKSPEKAVEACKAGADIVVVGNAIEDDMNLMNSIADAVHSIG
ncbi:MAG: geranylgeranylglyceryl/heptaprenylglyceryl phosphate synthase [Bacteroidota bacterium]|nr:geranylgeranylglyceryl/heptaprenylglyceryl phosphate synthase [Bacteroidota bacterium]